MIILFSIIFSYLSTKNLYMNRYEMQDLHVTETLPQMVALSEAYMQIYEQHEWSEWAKV